MQELRGEQLAGYEAASSIVAYRAIVAYRDAEPRSRYDMDYGGAREELPDV